MSETPAILLGCGLVLSGWLPPQIVARASLRRSLPVVALDLLIPSALFAWLCLLTARPAFSGICMLMLGGGFAFADRAKRQVLAEPIVFTDVFQAIDIFQHPRLALPFPHLGKVLLSVFAALALFVALFSFERARWRWSPYPGLALTAGIACTIWLSATVATRSLGSLFRRLHPSGDPRQDAASFGPFAMQLIHGLIARAERDLRRTPAPSHSRPHASPSEKGPIVLIQSESFFDARRLSSDIPADLLPNFDRCILEGAQWGRLSVPAWGANTVRTEFEVLSGLSRSEIGMDWFDPYHRFADMPQSSLAWKLRAEGYRTICIHPFDRKFYRRDQVMPHLGFDEFIGEEAFAEAQRTNGFVSDAELARMTAEIIESRGNNCFIFLITMENHGPWLGGPQSPPNGDPKPIETDSITLADAQAFACYLRGLRNADAMLGRLSEFMRSRAPDSLLAFYGDHLPSFPKIFSRARLLDCDTDYLIWKPGITATSRHDIAAARLGDNLLNKLYV